MKEAHAVAMRAQAPLEPLPEAMTPMTMLDRAVATGADPAIIEKMMGLYERWEANQARKEFNIAISEAKSKIPVILKEREGHNFKYEDLADIANVVDPILSELGLGYRYKSESNGEVKVTCVIFHRDGYSEENSLTSKPDATGSKNAIQAIGSAVTYLQRYTLKLALGLKVSKDDDGKAAGLGEAISDEQLHTIQDLIKEVNADTVKLCKYFKVTALTDIPVAKYQAVIDALEGKRKK